MPPLSLSDDELAAIMTACAPLAPDRRNDFLQAVANTLATCPMIGPGSVHRAIVTAQRQHFDPPLDMSRQPALLRKIERRCNVVYKFDRRAQRAVYCLTRASSAMDCRMVSFDETTSSAFLLTYSSMWASCCARSSRVIAICSRVSRMRR